MDSNTYIQELFKFNMNNSSMGLAKVGNFDTLKPNLKKTLLLQSASQIYCETYRFSEIPTGAAQHQTSLGRLDLRIPA